MNPSMQLLFDSLQDAIFIVSASGEVLFANLPAQTVLPITLGKPLVADWMASQLVSIRRGYLRPPITFEIDTTGHSDTSARTDRLHVTMLPSPVPGDLIVVMRKTSTEQMYENVIGNLAEMLDSEFRAPMEKFLGAADQMLAQLGAEADKNPALRESLRKVVGMAATLTGLLKQIGLLASTYKASAIRGDERIPVAPLVADAVLSARSLLGERRIKISYCGLAESLPVIYGSRSFLVQALAGYLRHLVERLDHGANILISATLHGNFIRLAITNCRGIAPDQDELQVLPLLGASDSKLTKLLGLTLPICRRVLELSGGKIYVDKDEGKVGTLTFELPVGAPTGNVQELEMKQAHRYAEDLRALMQRGTAATRH